MFDLFRSRDKAVRYLLGALLGLVALSMVITLIPGYGASSAPREQLVAEIGGEPLTVREVQQTIQAVTRNKQVPTEMLQFYLPQIVDQMITERAVAYQAKRMGFQITDQEVGNAIRSMLMQYFPDGNIPEEAYRQFLQRQGQDVAQFERTVRQNLLQLRLQNIALEGALVTPDEVQREFHRKNDKLKVKYIKYTTPSNLRSQVTVTPEDIKAHYESAKAQYTTPEKRSLNILIADEAKVAATMQVPEAQLRAAYNSQLDRFKTPERVKVRHILVKTTEKPKDEVPKLQAKAENLLKQLKGGADFAKLAKENSDDPGSAARGGDLDWVVRGQTVPEFEKAAFSLKKGELSNIVKTEYGFHILQVQDKEEAHTKSFDEVKDQLSADIRRDAVQNKMQQMVEQARAELIKSPQNAKADHVARGEAVPEIGTNSDLETATTGLKVNGVSEPFQAGPNKLAIAEVTQIFPSKPADLAEVQDQIRERLITEKTSRLAEQKTQEALTKMKAVAASGGDLAALAKELGVEVKEADFFTVTTAAEGIGPGSYLADGFTKPVGSFIGPFNISSDAFLAKSVDKQVADNSQLAAQRDAIVLDLKKTKANSRKELFEDGLLAQLIKEGKVKKYNDTITRILASYRS